MQSPLRYPGGKSDFSYTLFHILEQSDLLGRHLVEPYAGSAAATLTLLELGAIRSATLIERDPLIYSLWAAMLNRTDDLIERFIETDIDIKTWERLQPLLKVPHPTDNLIVDLAIAGLFFNRTNFSGILNAGPIGGKQQRSNYKIDCRTNKDDIICRILAIASLSDKIEPVFGDAIDYITRSKYSSGAFFYIDPPYYEKGADLYRYHYNIKDHKQLYRVLANKKFKWILSYDNHHVIEFLYQDFFIKRVNFQYSAGIPKNHVELLISNFEIPITPVVQRRARS